MLSVKVVYNGTTKSKVQGLLSAAGNPMFEFYNEDIPTQVKKAWKYKGAAAARELPFVGIYEDDKLIKALYSEDDSADSRHFYDWFEKYIKEHSKSGWMTIQKMEGINNENIQVGSEHSGYTDALMEGVSLLLTTPDRWFRTSPIVSIDWEKQIFHTCNSIYSFTLDENIKELAEQSSED